MNLPVQFFHDFLLRYQHVHIDTLQTAPPTQEASYVVMAHITNILSHNAFGVDVNVQDHTGTAVFALRGTSAMHFYDLHLPAHDRRHPVEDPFVLAGTWFGTYLFKIDGTRRNANNGRNGIIVSRICMHREIIDQFAQFRMAEEDYQSYLEALSTAIPSGPGYPCDGFDIAPNRAGCVGFGVGFRKRIYAPYMH